MTHPLGYRLTEEQVLLRDTIRTLAHEQIAPRAAEIDRSAELLAESLAPTQPGARALPVLQ